MSSVSIEQDLAAIARISAVPTILKTIRQSTGLRFTLVARVLPDRWVACAVHDEIEFGLGVGGELDVATTLCSQVRDTYLPILIDQASTDPKYSEHPTPKMYRFESYVAVPIFKQSGEYFGNVCGLDPDRREVNNEATLSTLTLFAELISLQLEAEERHAAGAAKLADEIQDSSLREQFIAVLGHDVRSPLSAITMATSLLQRTAQKDERQLIDRIKGSTRRIGSLVDDLMDLARGRLGGGIELQLTEANDLKGRLQQVVSEVRLSHPERRIDLRCEISVPVRVDEKRIEQLLSNLLANAVQHGAPGTPIEVVVETAPSCFSVRVKSHGAPIPDALRARLFQPYFRGGSEARTGLGLGLYIVSEIAKSHGGTMSVASFEGGNVFSFEMPLS